MSSQKKDKFINKSLLLLYMAESVREQMEQDVGGEGNEGTSGGGDRNGSWVGRFVSSMNKNRNKYILRATLGAAILGGGGALVHKFYNPSAPEGVTVVSEQVITSRTGRRTPERRNETTAVPPVVRETPERRSETPAVAAPTYNQEPESETPAVAAPTYNQEPESETPTVVVPLEEQCSELYDVSGAPTQDKILSCVEGRVAYLGNEGTCADVKPHYSELMELVDRLQQDNVGSQQTRMYILGSAAQKCEIPREDVIGLNPEQLEQRIFQE